jgi:hypothetical protein
MTGPLFLSRQPPDARRIGTPKALAKLQLDTVEVSRLIGGEQHQHSWSEAGRS